MIDNQRLLLIDFLLKKNFFEIFNSQMCCRTKFDLHSFYSKHFFVRLFEMPNELCLILNDTPYI